MNKNYFVVYSIAVLIRPIGYFGLWPLVGPSRTSSLEMYLRIKNACGLEILEWSLISILDGISSKTSLESFVYRGGPIMSAHFFTSGSKYECKLDYRRVHIWVQTSLQVGPNMSANMVTGRSKYECKLYHKRVQIWVQTFLRRSKYECKLENRAGIF